MSESRSAARRGRFLCLTALAFCAAGAPAVADVLAHYTFAGGSAASIDPHPDSTAGNMTIGAGLTGGYSAGNECAFASRATCGTTEGGAVTGNDYFQFTVTPGAGLALDLTSLRLRHMATTLEAGTDRWTSYLFVRASVDGFASNAGGVTSTRGSVFYDGTPPLDVEGSDVTLDLGDAAFQGLTEPVTFRIHLYQATATAGGADWGRFDDVVLDGGVASSPLILAVSGDEAADTVEFTWNSRSDMLYDLLSVDDLAADPASWDIHDDGHGGGYEGLPASGTGENTLTVPRPVGSARFFVVRETTAPFAPVHEAHDELWRRFIDEHGIMVDFTALDGWVNLPTPDECRDGKPNALGWYQTIENGAMFTGLYMDAAVNRWRAARSTANAEKARRLMEGLLLLASISEVPGFVGRGVSTDGTSHFAMGSEDQMLPWFYGLWRYLESGLATASERERIVAELVETAEAIVDLDWRIPAEPPFNTRGTFEGFHFFWATRQLFVMKMMHAVTGEGKWDVMYRAALEQRGGANNASKLELCQAGMAWIHNFPHNWTSCPSVAALRGLWELEEDAAVKSAFAEGLQASAALAAQSLYLATRFDNNDQSAFSQDWRQAMLPLWFPQQTEQEAASLAGSQLAAFLRISPRRRIETDYIREPTSAAWIVTLCPDPAIVRPSAAAIENLIAHYDYTRLYYVSFFWVESAWWQMKIDGIT